MRGQVSETLAWEQSRLSDNGCNEHRIEFMWYFSLHSKDSKRNSTLGAQQHVHKTGSKNGLLPTYNEMSHFVQIATARNDDKRYTNHPP